jgi:DNA invertase Pin-like site-specific DNA recombinase
MRAMDIGYARPGPAGRELDGQLAALREHGIPDERIYVDAPGETAERDAAINAAQPGDTIVVTTWDRLGLNVRDCLLQLVNPDKLAVRFRALDNPLAIDTAASADGLAASADGLLGLLGEMNLVYARERAALARSKTQSDKANPPGRPRKLNSEHISAFLAAVESGMNPEEAGVLHHISRSTAYRLVRESKTAAAAAVEK